MKAVILAAGVENLVAAYSIFPNLLRIGNQTILDYIFDALPEGVDTVIIVCWVFRKQNQNVSWCYIKGKIYAIFTKKSFPVRRRRY